MPLWITALAAGFAGILSGLGVGSAGIFVLYLTLFLNIEQVSAQGINLLFFILSAGASLIIHIRNRHVPWRLVGFLIVCAIPGCMLGTYLATRLDSRLIAKIFGGMLILSGCITLFRKSRNSSQNTLAIQENQWYNKRNKKK